MLLYRWIVLVVLLVFVASAARGEHWATDPDVPVLQELEQRQGRNPEYPLAVMVKVGMTASAQTLFDLDWDAEISIQVEEGPARLLYRRETDGEIEALRVVSYRSNSVILPSVDPVEVKSNSYISIRVDGVEVIDRIKVYFHPDQMFQAMHRMPSFGAMVLRWVEGEYALIDQSLLDPEAFFREAEGVKDLIYTKPNGEPMPLIPPPHGGSSLQSGCGTDCPGFCPWEVVVQGTGGFTTDTGCPFYLSLAGRIDWQFAYPRILGFSYKPEEATPLKWASPPTDHPLDGLYRSSWGCLWAVKIPGNIIMIAHPSVGQCCQGLVAKALNKHCTVVANPGSLPSWPACALI